MGGEQPCRLSNFHSFLLLVSLFPVVIASDGTDSLRTSSRSWLAGFRSPLCATGTAALECIDWQHDSSVYRRRGRRVLAGESGMANLINRHIRLFSAAGVSLSSPERAVVITPEAFQQIRVLKQQRAPQDSVIYLRMGVKSGGCSGLSYTLSVCSEDEIQESDHVEDYPEEGISCVVDGKSLIYVFGLHLNYSNELIGGGFRFDNPNARKSCGCGMSFGVSKEVSQRAPESIPAKPKSCVTDKK